MFDNVCKFLAESFSQDFATWLLNEPITLTQLSPSELSLEPIRADALILLQSDEIVLHLEFQTRPDADIPFRMCDYRLRVYRRFPQKRMRQVVIYLQPSDSELVYQTEFVLENTRHRFEVIRLWEQPTELFFNSPGLLPFATLSQTENQRQTLEQVAEVIEAINDTRIRSNVAASTAVLAGLVLKKDEIKRILRSDIMRESVIYQDILQEGLKEGFEQKAQEIAINMLNEGIAIALIVRVTGLTVEQVEHLQRQTGNNQAQ
ncbi:Rpn family recombination-promoting nuclease/putative transposase [Calothrix sp. FACHB-1219]|uniref:Rpn family recombination-promoting nuclease/putative transposase n=1 Tax=unclassified Calothrix TaxID=2619626 RepID=UPI001688803D|nr:MULTISPECIES: Rpn family recombination-promoting nuclease/putative transposase [unclassified Calothrix]MBD2202385.1 Rpn family recombination-promoting nuclease/putative transposase [Calothrix sp. FACHB-168]MBD2222361.1 Rpn family recombination-promoting nuclease/putative transposase [Calothrix sp. FACHB-1219]